jgi:hypothetical protein
MPAAVISYVADSSVPNFFAAVSLTLSAGEIQLSYQGILDGQPSADARSFRGSSPIFNAQNASCAGSVVLPIPAGFTFTGKGGFSALAVSFVNTSTASAQASITINVCRSDGSFSTAPYSQTVTVAAQSAEHFHLSFQPVSGGA